LQIKTKIVSCHTAVSKPVKQEVNGTLIPPPSVFSGFTLKDSTNLQKPESDEPVAQYVYLCISNRYENWLMTLTTEEIIDEALTEEKSGRMGSLRIHRGSLYRPRGGILYLQRNANLNSKGKFFILGVHAPSWNRLQHEWV